jgi:hypothetical protein
MMANNAQGYVLQVLRVCMLLCCGSSGAHWYHALMRGPSQRLLPFTQYEDSRMRRGGVIGALRNCCFDAEVTPPPTHTHTHIGSSLPSLLCYPSQAALWLSSGSIMCSVWGVAEALLAHE